MSYCDHCEGQRFDRARVLRELPHIAEFQKDVAERAKAAAEKAKAEASKKP